MATTASSHAGVVLDAVTLTFFAIALIFCSLCLYSDVGVLHYARIDTYIAFAVSVSVK